MNAHALADVYSHIAYPFVIDRGQGMKVIDEENREYLDFYGGHCVCSIGHSPKAIVDAVSAQGEKLLFYSNLAPLRIREEAAQDLLAFADNEFTQVFFCNSGAEANENALKVAVKASQRKKIVGFTGGFHGRTLLALTATHIPSWHEQYSAWIGHAEHLTPNDESQLSAVDTETAAVILEPIQSIGGCTVFEQSYLKKLRARCDEVGALLIFDEVQTGIGRTGMPFVSGHSGVQPDMMTLAKGLAGGFPIGAVLFTEKVAKTLAAGDIAATFGGSPLALAAMRATLSEITRLDLSKHALSIERYIRENCTLPQVQRIAGAGCLLGLELDREAKPVQAALFEKGIIVGTNSNKKMLHLLPPLIVQTEDVDRLLTALQEILS